MEPPLFSIGKGNNIINVSPSVIRFWEKTGLHPLGGRKNVNAFVMYEGESMEMFGRASQWFKRVSIAYTVRLYFLYTTHHFHIMVVQEFRIP
jgi:mediator of RNA polymerase II transcription subunit 13, fungi type